VLTPRRLEARAPTCRVAVRARRTPARAARWACRLPRSGPPCLPLASRVSLRALHAQLAANLRPANTLARAVVPPSPWAPHSKSHTTKWRTQA
jgi:hypothetical protein